MSLWIKKVPEERFSFLPRFVFGFSWGEKFRSVEDSQTTQSQNWELEIMKIKCNHRKETTNPRHITKISYSGCLSLTLTVFGLIDMLSMSRRPTRDTGPAVIWEVKKTGRLILTSIGLWLQFNQQGNLIDFKGDAKRSVDYVLRKLAEWTNFRSVGAKWANYKVSVTLQAEFFNYIFEAGNTVPLTIFP